MTLARALNLTRGDYAELGFIRRPTERAFYDRADLLLTLLDARRALGLHALSVRARVVGQEAAHHLRWLEVAGLVRRLPGPKWIVAPERTAA